MNAKQHAQAYARLGWYFFPLKHHGKEPDTLHGFKDASTEIQPGWFHNGSNIGLRTGPAFWVLDEDPAKGGTDTLQALQDKHGPLPNTLVQITRNGGRHYFFAADARVTCGTEVLGPGLDHKGVGGYIVAEPSEVPADVPGAPGRYEFLDFSPLDDQEPPPLAKAPEWLISLIAKPQKTTTSSSKKTGTAGKRKEGSRNEFLSREAFRLRKKGLDVDAIHKVILQLDREACDPPLQDEDPGEVRRIAEGKLKVEPDPQPAAGAVLALDQFYAHLPTHRYINIVTGDMMPAESVNGAVEWPINGRKPEKPSAWLDRERPVLQMTWMPGKPQIIEEVVVRDGGIVAAPDAKIFNQYRAPAIVNGDARKASRWIDHLRVVYPDTADHILAWWAHRVQRPAEKVNHALVLGGNQGIGKDTLLEPVKRGVGEWNWAEVSPTQLQGRFNSHVKSVVLRISEARDLGDVDRFGFYDHSKTLIAAPPNTLLVDEKNVPAYYVPNVTGVIITTNHQTDGIYLPPDDRRHHVSGSAITKDDFTESYWTDLWTWYERSGFADVITYLRQYDLSKFNPKAPPPKTDAWRSIVMAGIPDEESELREAIERLGSPDVLSIRDLSEIAATHHMWGVKDFLTDKKLARQLPHRLGEAGYVGVPNKNQQDGRWKVKGKNVRLYAKRELTVREQHAAIHAYI